MVCRYSFNLILNLMKLTHRTVLQLQLLVLKTYQSKKHCISNYRFSRQLLSLYIITRYLYWEPLFVDCQNIACLRGCNFVGKWFVALQCKTIHYYMYVRGLWGHKFVGKGNPRNPWTLITQYWFQTNVPMYRVNLISYKIHVSTLFLHKLKYQQRKPSTINICVIYWE